jgi:hypothetical protein
MMVAGMVLVASFSAVSRYMEGEKGGPLIHISFNEAGVDRVLDDVVGTKSGEARDRGLPEEKAWDFTAETLIIQDPVLALAKLRIDLERELRRIAFESDLDIEARRMTIGTILNVFAERRVLDQNVISAIRDVLPACNLAIHGGDVTLRLANSVINIGERLIRILRSVRYSRTTSSM